MATLIELNLYPIKSCGGIALREASLSAAGLTSGRIYDREWMVVDAQGEFLTQREYPKMAVITPHIGDDMLELRAPRMRPLAIPLDPPDPDHAPTLQVRLWEDTVKAYDCDATTAAWFSDVLGTTCRLARFHPHAKRVADARWTGGIEAPTLFADGFSMLVIAAASLDDLNQKLTAQGRQALPMNRFRPNIVIDGVGAFEEDYAHTLHIGGAILKPVKPCPRCPIPSVDQATGTIGPDPLTILQTYRANPKVDGGITFGMNAILLQGAGQRIHVGQEIEVNFAFAMSGAHAAA
jgi:uncharacterized protein YcbX